MALKLLAKISEKTVLENLEQNPNDSKSKSPLTSLHGLNPVHSRRTWNPKVVTLFLYFNNTGLNDAFMLAFVREEGQI